MFKLGDGERIVSMMSFDARSLPPGSVEPTPGRSRSADPDAPEPPFALAVTRGGLGLRFSLRNHAEVSTRAGRKFARLNEDDEVLTVVPLGMYQEADWIMCVADDGHALAVEAEEVSLLSGPGKGVMVMKVAKGARLLGAELGHRDLDVVSVETGTGKMRQLTLRSIAGSRGGKGSVIVKRGGFAHYFPRPVETPNIGEQ
jgi:DNA gyrase subunit A